MPTAIVTGSGGLIGSESVRRFVADGFDVVGIENDMRAAFFGADASTRDISERLVDRGRRVPVARPRHPRRGRRRGDLRPPRRPTSSWSSTPPRSRRTTGPRASRRPTSRSTPTARSTCSRRRARHAPEASFVFCSTNKVYGDLPNALPLVEPADAARAARRPPLVPRASTRRCRSTARTHSLFGVSKAAADLLVQEYGRYFGMPHRVLPRRLPDRPRATPAPSCTASSPT